jgi:predicted RNA-binding protein
MHAPSFKFSYIFQIYTHNPIENLWRIEKVGKIAIIKQQIESMCIFMKFYLKMQKLQAGNHLQQDVDF